MSAISLVNGTALQILRLALGAACFAALWQFADGAAALRYLGDADGAWIVAALLALTLQTLLSALRWRLTARQLGIALHRAAAVREYYLSQFVNQLLPGGVLGDAGRALRARAQAGLLASGQAVLFERVAGQLGLLALFTLGVLGTRAVPGGFAGPDWLLYAALLPVLTAVIAAALWQLADGMQAGVPAWIPARLRSTARGFRTAFMRSLAAPQVITQQSLLSLGTAACNVAAFVCCAVAVGAALSLPAALVLVPVILLTMLVPLAPSGWGLREGAAAVLLPLAGLSSAEGLAASVAFGLALLVATLPGLIALALAAAPGTVKS